MSTLESPTLASTVRDKAASAIRQAADVAREKDTIKRLATDAFSDGVYAAKRAVKTARRGIERAADVRDDVMYRVKRDPLKALGAAFGVGLLAGAAVGWISGYRWNNHAGADE